jgi:hypothetical protein
MIEILTAMDNRFSQMKNEYSQSEQHDAFFVNDGTKK